MQGKEPKFSFGVLSRLDSFCTLRSFFRGKTGSFADRANFVPCPFFERTFVVCGQTQLGERFRRTDERDGDVVKAEAPIAGREQIARHVDGVIADRSDFVAIAVIGHDQLFAQVIPLRRDEIAFAYNLVA